MRFVSGGRQLALLRVKVVLAALVVFVVLQLGKWMMVGDDVPLLRLRRMKLAVSGSDDQGEDPRPTFHKVSVSLLTITRFIGSKSILVCEDALPNLGMMVVCLFFLRCRRTMADNDLARHMFLQWWNYNFTSYRVFYVSLLNTHVYVLW
jgi:hypothetical protein